MTFYFKTLDLAKEHQAIHGGRIWELEIGREGQREFRVALLATLIRDYLAAQDKGPMHECLFRNQPARLFYDLDGKKIEPNVMVHAVLELIEKTKQFLAHWHPDCPEPSVIELDGSRPEKQSRHLIFDVSFESIAQMSIVIAAIKETCSKQTKDLIDMAPYNAEKSSMRLALARKYKRDSQPLLPKNPDSFVFEKSLICLADESVPLLRVEEEHRVIQCDNPALSQAAENLNQAFAMFRPFKPTLTGNVYKTSLTGIVCPNIGRPHASNRCLFIVYFGRQPEGRFRCLDVDCNRLSWFPQDLDLEAICFPERVLHELQGHEFGF